MTTAKPAAPTNQTPTNQTTTHIVDVGDDFERPRWLPVARWPFRLRHYQHDLFGREALDIHYTDEGDGPVLLFVHAGMWSFIWRDAISRLRGDFRCITLDFPGAGLSEGGPVDVDLKLFPSIIDGLLDHLAIDSATFVVHDLGGAVGVIAAGLRPDRATGLVATNAFAWPADGRALKIMLAVMGSRITTGLLGTFRIVPRLSRSKAGVGRHYEVGDREAFFGPYRRRAFSRNFHRAMRSARRSTELFEEAEKMLRSELAHLPVLTVFGEKNDPFRFADRWRRLFPSASGWTVPGGNHFPMCDDPAGYAERLRVWHRNVVVH